MKKNRLAIVGIFYDGYYDMWEDFLELFSVNWKDCPYDLYIVNNEKELNYNKDYNVNVLHAGKDAEYSKKVQVAIDQIDTDYYLLLLEDFFIQKQIDNQSIEKIMEFITYNDINYYRMQIIDFINKANHNNAINKISPQDEYTLTCQPSIWEKSFLKKCIGKENYNAWIFEGVYVLSKEAHTESFLDKCYVDYSDPLHLRHGAVQGKILPNVYDDFKREGYNFRNKREILSKKEFEKHLFKQKIKTYVPLKIQGVLKKTIKTSSVIDKYKSEIVATMKKMNIN